MYNKKELARVFSISEVLGIICSSLAPCSPMIFYGIHLELGRWIITQDNFIGIFLATISFILLIISYFHLHNLTQDKTFHLLKDQILDGKSKEGEEESKKKTTKLWGTKDIETNGNLMFLLCTEAFLSFSYFQMDLIITMTAVRSYGLTLLQLSVLTTFVVVIATLCLYTIQRRFLVDKLNTYFLYMFGFVIIAFFESFLLLAWSFDLKSIYSQMTTLFILVFCNLVQGVGSTVYCRLIMFAISPSHSASIVESHRFMFCRIMASIGFFTSSYVFDVLWLVIPFYVCLCFMIVVLYAFKRNHYT